MFRWGWSSNILWIGFSCTTSRAPAKIHSLTLFVRRLSFNGKKRSPQRLPRALFKSISAPPKFQEEEWNGSHSYYALRSSAILLNFAPSFHSYELNVYTSEGSPIQYTQRWRKGLVRVRRHISALRDWPPLRERHSNNTYVVPNSFPNFSRARENYRITRVRAPR